MANQIQDPIRDLERLSLAVQRLRLSLLGLFAVAGLVVVLAGAQPSAGFLDRGQRIGLVLALAAGAIITRQTALGRSRPPRARLRGLLWSYVLSGAVGLLGVATALWAGETTQGLGFLAAAALFVIGGPSITAGPRAARPGF